MSTTTDAPTSGFAPVNGLQLYYESSGDGGTPLILVHGGYGSTGMVDDLSRQLAEDRRVISVDLQGHGRTADTDRSLSFEAMGDDIAALAKYLGLEAVDLMGYSMGGGATLRAAIQHPGLVRRVVLVSAPMRNTGWYPEIYGQMRQINRGMFDMMRATPLYEAYRAIAPDPDAFPDLMDKMGTLLAAPYDWSEEVRHLRAPTMVIYGDADSIPATHAVEFFQALGGAQRDGGWDGSGLPAARLAILPATTHYTIVRSPLLAQFAGTFLAD